MSTTSITNSDTEQSTVSTWQLTDTDRYTQPFKTNTWQPTANIRQLQKGIRKYTEKIRNSKPLFLTLPLVTLKVKNDSQTIPLYCSHKYCNIIGYFSNREPTKISRQWSSFLYPITQYPSIIPCYDNLYVSRFWGKKCVHCLITVKKHKGGKSRYIHSKIFRIMLEERKNLLSTV